ncbi:MAG: nicotinate-nucleotide--dimethylbenzimidazole phosphoribosyltransferase [Rhizobiaceae bacterium]|nr:nicotinate-nucleotide--dimethylbenzimidazole phosphoribosyltransferase [Rhizobiaceae bacterium]
MSITLPFDDFRALLMQLHAPDRQSTINARAAFGRRNGGVEGGRFGDVGAWYASLAGGARLVARAQIAIFAGTHGVVRHGISRLSVSSTVQAVAACGDGSATICKLCQTYDLGLKVFDLALDVPTADITQKPALDERACAATMAFGMEAVMEKPDVLCLASFGPGSSTVSAALLAALHGGPAGDWLAGSDNELIAQRTTVVEDVLALHGPHCADPLEALCRIGGREFAAMAGAILAAGVERIPVVLHGKAAFCAAAVLAAVQPDALSHCILAEKPANLRMAELAQKLGLSHVFDAGFNGETDQPLSGALAIMAIKGAAASAT